LNLEIIDLFDLALEVIDLFDLDLEVMDYVTWICSNLLETYLGSGGHWLET